MPQRRMLCACAVVAMVAVSACGYSGPPDIDVAREGIRPEYRIVLQGQDGKTALDLLREHTEDVVVQDSGDGALVSAINGIEAGVEGRYWLYYVNEKAALIAADRMNTVDGDSIEWLFAR